MQYGNRETAIEVLQELERELSQCYIVGNDDVARAVNELREALQEA